VSPRQLGATSFTLRAEFRIADRETVIAVAETVYVLVDAPTLQKRPLPDRFRAALESGAVGVESDHAGYGTR
jgi:acyl-CoA thioester hydrolase